MFWLYLRWDNPYLCSRCKWKPQEKQTHKAFKTQLAASTITESEISPPFLSDPKGEVSNPPPNTHTQHLSKTPWATPWSKRWLLEVGLSHETEVPGLRPILPAEPARLKGPSALSAFSLWPNCHLHGGALVNHVYGGKTDQSITGKSLNSFQPWSSSKPPYFLKRSHRRRDNSTFLTILRLGTGWLSLPSILFDYAWKFSFAPEQRYLILHKDVTCMYLGRVCCVSLVETEINSKVWTTLRNRKNSKIETERTIKAIVVQIHLKDPTVLFSPETTLLRPKVRRGT